MPERPLLILPNPEPVDRPKGQDGPNTVSHPDRTKQAQRIEQQFAQVQDAFVSDEPADIERVLVMETSGQIGELQNAVQKIDGLEWLAEMEVDDIELHDLYDEKTSSKIRGGRFYLLSSNKSAIGDLLGLWKKYQRGEKLERGYGKFTELFKYLITLRLWDVRDRMRDTGILDVWKEEYQLKQGTNSDMEFEIELHYRKDERKRNECQQEVIKKIQSAGGSVGQSACMKEIAFHALKAKLPVAGIEQVISSDWNTNERSSNLPPIFNSEAVRYFRPIGQHIGTEQEPSEYPEERTLPPIEDKPSVLALLDGAPIVRHKFLDGRIDSYDPDDYIADYTPSQQKHGTAMASLICHGDISRSQSEGRSLTRRIYVRPVMKPDPTKLSSNEEIPADLFQEDIIEKSVREMFEGEPPSAPDVRVINLSLGNINQHYLHEMSPWARLLDWLSFKYKILFIVSAGNYLDSIRMKDSSKGSSQLMLLNGCTGNDRKSVISGIDKNQRNHRLLSPAESMNALTVGALQGDYSGELNNSIRGSDPISDESLPAPYSRIGPGYLGVVKPEIFTHGGRLLYDKNPRDTDLLEPVYNNDPPGVQVAYPGSRPETLTNTVYISGTSNAAAIVTHGAGHIFEVIEELRKDHNDVLPSDLDAVLIKTLLVHSASQKENAESYEHLKNKTNSRRLKRYCSRFLGYGNIDVERVLTCTQTRATGIGCGNIKEKERHRFFFPLPASSSIGDYLRLTVTLAWFSPINPFHIGLRKARLFFKSECLKGENGHKRMDADWQQTRKGTIQHEIFELKKSNLPGDTLELFIECAAAAGTLDEEISYGLAITLEVAEKESINLYQIVKENIQQRVTIE